MCKSEDNYDPNVSNQDLIENAGKVKLDDPERWGKGIIKDIKGTIGKYWVAEMTNFNQKTIAITLLLFISVIAPTLAFGASYSKATNNEIGAIETILATSYVGMAMALLSGMPMCIVGSTGPILAVTAAMADLAESFDVPFLTFNAWVSIWLLFYVFIASFFDLTRYVRLATRFTDDIFAFLIVSIFVLRAIGDPFSKSGLLHYLNPDHKFHQGQAEDYAYYATAFLSILLGLGTTWLIFFFRGFKASTFFCSQSVRNTIFDFSVSVSVVVWCCVKEFGFPDIPTETLNVPDSFEPTFACCDSSCTTYFPDQCPDQAEAWGVRSWLVDLGDLNGKTWLPFVAAGPAILAFLACYLDNGITWHLINHKSHKLQHGEAYNYDLLLNGIFNCINGLLGLPWLVATTVPCIIHLNGLADKDKDGKFHSVQETRLTGFFAHLIMALSILALDVLKLVPLPVLLGVFLFMGLSSLPGMQFWQRILMVFREPDLYPDTVYTKYMSKGRIHKYTLFQMLFFAGVFVVQNIKLISIGFPFMTLLCIPGRLYLLPKFFEGWELALLDGEDEEIEKWIEAKEGRRKSVLLGDEDKDDLPAIAETEAKDVDP